LAEMLALRGVSVSLVTSESLVSPWTRNTEEQPRVQKRLIELGVRIEVNTVVEALSEGEAQLACVFTGRKRTVEAATVVMVTSRKPDNALYSSLGESAQTIRIGDCRAPGTIAASVRSGHRYAQEMDAGVDESQRGAVPFLREEPKLFG